MPRIESELLKACELLHQKNYLAAADGNLSYKKSKDEILITPSGKMKAFLQENDLCLMDSHGESLKGKPSSEKIMHLMVYQNCPEAKCVIHAHPPHAVAWSIAKPDMSFLPAAALSEVLLATGGIPIVPYARAGTVQMGEVLRPFLKDYRVMILARHGALAWGEDIEEAYRGMERLEHSSEILFKAQLLGGVTSLPDEEVEALKLMREKIGKRTL